MNRLLKVFALLLLIYSSSLPAVDDGHDPLMIFQSHYGALLKKYWRPSVQINGIDTTVFDYAAMARDSKSDDSLLYKTLAALERVDPAELETDNQAKAFWINAYNFTAMKLVVDHYPVDSIRSLKISLIKHPWSKKIVRIGNEHYSLEQIEKDILLKKYQDPRIIFSVSCAAVSCPDRMPEPFAAEQLDVQLDAMIRTFFSNPKKGALLDKRNGVLTLSWILDKDEYLFENYPGRVLGFVLPYLNNEEQRWLEKSEVTLRYFDHDWTLNDQALADQN